MEAKIIIQDNNLHTANALRTLLSTIGYSVITVKTVKGLSSLIVKFKPNLVIIECTVPEKEAQTFLADLKKNFRVRVICTTCDANRSYLIKNIGFDDCLAKPYDVEEVQQIIKKQIAA